MTRITTNFRGLRATILSGDSANAERLAEILERLGFIVSGMGQIGGGVGNLPPSDLVFLDADEEIAPALLEGLGNDLPMIALIGNEAPSRLARVVRFGCSSHILKPIRHSGVYSAIVLAISRHEHQRRTDEDLAALRQRLAGRRLVMKAVIKQMHLCAIDEDTAYDLLRKSAMERRISIEAVARMALGLPETDEPPSPRRRSRKA